MTSQQTWQDNFRRRCDFVGWQTELSKGSNHYKVHNAAGKYLFTYAKTTGDRRAMLNTLAEAKRHGLEQLETGEKLRRERDRLARIEKDRETNGYVVIIDPVNESERIDEGEREVISIGKYVIENHHAADRDHVGEVKVVVRQKAHLGTRNMSTGSTELHPYPDIDELQLADETVVYQCASRRDSSCLFTAAKPESIRAHLRSHSPRTEAVKLAAELAEATKKAEATEAELAARIERRSNASRQGAETRRRQSRSTSVETPSIEAVRLLADRVESVISSVETLVGGMNLVVHELGTISHELAKLPVTDQATLDKAAAFDAIRTQLKLS